MAVRETHILLDFIADADPLREVNQQINNTIRHTRDIARNYDGLTDASKIMMKEMNSGWRNQSDAFKKFRNDLVSAEYDYHNLARGTAFFGDSTDDLLKAITRVGLAHKKATEGMMNSSDQMRRKFYQTIGTMANMTPQADKNRDALSRMNNPLYNANKLGLGLVSKMSRVTYTATAAAMALKLLGPSANMKELNDETKRLKKSLGAMTLVAIGAGLGAFFFYGAMHKAAMANEEYSKSWETMKDRLRKAIQPMVDVFIMIMVPVYKFITGIANLIIKFNEAHPVIAKMIQGVILLIPALTLLLLPLGLGIGLVNGYKLAFGFFFKMLMPLVTFLATMSATVWIVAIAIIALGAAFIWAWNNVAWFRDGIIAAWNWIKTATMAAFLAIKAAVMPAIQAIVAFGAEKLAEFKSIWQTNSGWILALVTTHFKNIWAVIKMVMGIIKGIFQVIWPQISAITQVAWALIKIIISTALNVVMGIIKAVMSLIQGDWEGAWSAIRGIFTNTWNDIKNYLGDIDLRQIGIDMIKGLINGISSMVGAVGDAISGIVSNIKSAFTNPLKIESPSRLFHEYGQNTFQGYNNGAMSEVHNVERTIRQVAEVPVEQAQMGNTSTSSTNNSKRSFNFNPTINVNGGGESSGNVKQQVKDALDEAFGYVTTMYALDGDY